MPRIRMPARTEAAFPNTSEDFGSKSSQDSSSISSTTPGGVTFAALTPLIGFSVLLGVVVDDIIIDFCNNAEWKKAYYAAHRTATLPTCAFVPLAIVVGFGGFLYNLFVSNTSSISSISISSSSSSSNSNSSKSSSNNITTCISEEDVTTTPDGSNKRRSSTRRKSSSSTSKNVAVCIDSPSLHAPISPPTQYAHLTCSSSTTPSLLLDWRVLLTIGLGLCMYLLFAHSLVPRQDFIAHVVVSDKSRLRSAGQVQEALGLIRQGHLLLFGALGGLVALQVSLLAGGGARRRRS